MADSTDERGEVFGERWFPVGEVSVESMRERVPGIDYPPTSRIHVWFARRPLLTSRAAILGSLLPMDYSRKDLFKLLAIPDNLDVVGLYNQLLRAKAEKRKIKNPCSWTQAYKVPISEESTNHLRSSVPQQILLLDPFAGGGSIPLEAIRMGLPIVANDLNPVAYICLKGTVEYPAQFGMRLIQAVEEFCAKIHRAAKTELLQYFPKNDDEDVFSYLWTRTIACPHCSLEIPLSPNWWVAKTDGLKVAVRPEVTEEGHRCSFTVIQDPKQHGFDPDIGTASGGDAICPRCRSTVSSEQVKAAAQADRMGHQLYCVCTKIPKMRGRGKDWIFRAPTDQDIKTVDAVNAVVEAERTQWPAWQWIPSERYPEDANDTRPLQYGMPYWSDFFNPRQLLTHAIYMKQFSETKRRLFDTLVPGSDDWQFASAVTVYGAMVFDSCVNYNSMHPMG